MRWVIGLAVSLALGVGAARADGPSVLVVERIAAVVGRTPILESQVAARQSVGGAASPGRAAVLEQLIEEQLIALETKRLGITLGPDDVDRAVARVKSNNGLTDAQFAEALVAQGYSMEAYRSELAAQIIRYRTFNAVASGRVQVTDAEIEALNRERGGGKLSAEQREALRTELYEAKFAVEMTAWLRELRAQTFVEVR
jgi:peptidyl-prolyl cis-trans isomerase SurA